MKTSSFPRTLLIALCAAAAVSAGLTLKADNSSLDSKDKSFLQDAYKDGLAEVDTAKMVQQKTSNPDVKAFAAKLVTDHSAANAELKTLADSKKVSVASEPSMVARGKSKLLDAKSGGSFDKAYIDDMVSDHKKDISVFEKEASEAKDQDVKKFAKKTLPTLKEHLSAAEAIQSKIGK